MNILNKDTLRFPAVTVCNQNPIHRSILLESPKWKNIATMDSEFSCSLVEKIDCEDLRNKIRKGYEKAVERCHGKTLSCSDEKLNLLKTIEKSRKHAQDSSNEILKTVAIKQLQLDDSQDTAQKIVKLKTNKRHIGQNYAGVPINGYEQIIDAKSIEKNKIFAMFEEVEIADYKEYANEERENEDYTFFDMDAQFLDKLDDINEFEDGTVIETLLHHSDISDLSDVTSLLHLPFRDLMQNRSDTGINRFILECSFDRKRCHLDQDFIVIYNVKYGQCFTFNSRAAYFKTFTSDPHETMKPKKTVKSTRRSGSEFGLRLTLNINASEYVGLLASHVGARISIHTPAETPYPQLDGLNAPPGMLTDIALKRVAIKRLREPFESKCVSTFPAEYRKHGLIDRGMMYSTLGCKIACMDTHMQQTCGCIDQTAFYNLTKHNYFNVCDIFNKTQRNCQRRIQQKFIMLPKHPLALNCNCPQACAEIKFQSFVSLARWPSAFYLDLHLNNFQSDSPIWRFYNDLWDRKICKNHGGSSPETDRLRDTKTMTTIEDNLVRLQIYYGDLNYDFIEETESYSFSKMMADLGGVLGLYLGLSVATLFEVFQYVAFILVVQVQKFIYSK